MARRKQNTRQKKGGVATEQPPPTSAEEQRPTDSPPSRGRFLSVCLVTILWVTALALLAVSTANEPMLNRAQIEQAELIVTAEITDAGQGSVRIDKAWTADGEDSAAAGKTITVQDLAKSKAKPGRTWLLPLTHVEADTFEITRPLLTRDRDTVAEADRPPRVYEATEDALEQLRGILGTQK